MTVVCTKINLGWKGLTRGRIRELKNAHNSVTAQNRTHVYMNFFDHKDLGNHILQYCPQVAKHPVYIYICNSNALNDGKIHKFNKRSHHQM